MTLFFSSNEIIIFRRKRRGSSDRYAMSATFTAYSADIQPAGLDRVELVSGRFGAVYTAFVDATVDIKEGDQVVSSGKTYSVKGVTHWQGAGLLDHMELILVAQDG